MILCDTHTHLYANEFDNDRDAMVQRAFNNGVTKILLPNIDSSCIDGMKALVDGYPKNCFAMMGVHPCSIKEDYKTELALAEKELFSSSYKYYGVGEMGLDLYWDKTFFNEQKEAFIQQVKWSIELNLPLSIHTREATDEAVGLLNLPELQGARGVFHCFGGTMEQARQVIGLGFHLGIGGVLTFKNSDLGTVLNDIDMQHIVLETDSPYLAPVPYRGKRNESAYIANIAQKLAEIKGLTLDEVARITTQNVQTVFGI
jgi:TatD DNase family protein